MSNTFQPYMTYEEIRNENHYLNMRKIVLSYRGNSKTKREIHKIKIKIKKNKELLSELESEIKRFAEDNASRKSKKSQILFSSLMEGKSNYEIASTCDCSIRYVQKVLKEFRSYYVERQSEKGENQYESY